jgi:hypothetical protein
MRVCWNPLPFMPAAIHRGGRTRRPRLVAMERHSKDPPKKSQLLLLLLLVCTPVQADLFTTAERGFVHNGDVRIHYATVGDGPVVVMIHGFPDFWYTWRHQMQALAGDFKVLAIDQRGYTRSGQPEGKANYAMPLLVSDVAAVIGPAILKGQPRFIQRPQTAKRTRLAAAVAFDDAFHVRL